MKLGAKYYARNSRLVPYGDYFMIGGCGGIILRKQLVMKKTGVAGLSTLASQT